MSKYALFRFGSSAAWAVSAACCLASAGCVHTLIFSDEQAIGIVGYKTPPPPPPEAPKPAPPPAAPEAPKRVEVQQDKIVIHDTIQFETDQAIIKPESYGLMDEITLVVANNPQIQRLSIQGHTDATGGDAHNQKLSNARAYSVLEYLVQHGVAPERLTSKGWGENKPIATNATAEGREKNRRVEFVIVQQVPINRTYEIDPRTGEQREVAAPSLEPTEPTPAGPTTL